MSAPRIDVVIATFDRQVRLMSTLRSLTTQTLREFGVIVVDDGSRPAARAVAPPELTSELNVRWLGTPTNSGAGSARNVALAASSADFIAFLDDDVDADPGWLAAHVAAQESADRPTVTIGPLLAPRDWRPTAWNRWEAAKLAVEYARMGRGEYVPTWRQLFTGNAMASRSLLLAAGGFNAGLRRAEDIELGVRLAELGALFKFEPEAKGWHYASRPCASWLGNADRYAEVDHWLDAAYPKLRWRELIDDELRARSAASHAVRAAAKAVLGERLTVSAAVLAARALNRRPTGYWAVRAASLAYDVRYRSALARHRAASA